MGSFGSPFFGAKMSILFDYDPMTGVSQHFDYDPTKDLIHLTTTQDLTAFMENLKQKRDNPDYWKHGVKEEFAHYATIPAIVEIELRKKGLDIHNSNQTKEILKEINTNYPYLKTTTAHHE
jgi:hypothetical protein